VDRHRYPSINCVDARLATVHPRPSTHSTVQPSPCSMEEGGRWTMQWAEARSAVSAFHWRASLFGVENPSGPVFGTDTRLWSTLHEDPQGVVICRPRLPSPMKLGSYEVRKFGSDEVRREGT
jgi:hypothetical protein